MNTKLFRFALLGILSVILLASAVSATVDFVDVSGASQSVSRGTQATISFKVEASTFSGQIDNATLELPNLFGSTTSWAGDTGLFTLFPNSNVSKTVRLTIPTYQEAGTYFDYISLDGSYNMSGSVVVHNLPINITINSVKSLSVSKITELSASHDGVINVTNTGNVDMTNINLSASGLNLSFSTNNLDLSPGDSETVTVSSPVNLSELKFGDYTATITAKDLIENTTATTSFSVEKHFCKNGEARADALLLNSISISGSDDDSVWKLLDEITVTVKVKNDGNGTIRKVQVVMGLFDSDGNNAVGDLDFSTDGEETIDVGSITKGSTEEVKFEFKVPADLDEDDYKLAIKAYSDDDGEGSLCTDSSEKFDSDFYQEIEVTREDDSKKLVAVKDITLNPVKATAGDEVTLTFNVYNVGADEQDKIKIAITSTDLNIKEESVLTSMSSGDGEIVELKFTVPSGIKDGQHTITFTADYDYSSSKGTYKTRSSQGWSAKLETIGNTPAAESFVDVSAKLDSSSKAAAGEELVVLATIKNTGNSTSLYSLSAKGYDSWASLSSISEQAFTLNAGASKDVKFRFKVNSGVSGEQTFNIDVASGLKVDSREVAVTIEGSKGLFSSLASAVSGGSTMVWVIVAINVILIVFIIIVAVSLSRR